MSKCRYSKKINTSNNMFFFTSELNLTQLVRDGVTDSIYLSLKFNSTQLTLLNNININNTINIIISQFILLFYYIDAFY